MSGLEPPTHGDILEKLGELKGQVTALISLVGQRQGDLEAIRTRVGALEIKVAQGVILCAALAMFAPLVIPRVGQAIFAETQHQGR